MTQYARPDSDIDKGDWDDPNGNNNNILYDDIDEAVADDGDYIQTFTDDGTCEVGLSGVTDPVSAINHTIKVRAKDSANLNEVDVNLKEGAVQRATFLMDLTNAFAEYSYTLNAAEANSITNYNDLSLEFVASVVVIFTTAYISHAVFEVPDAGGAAVYSGRGIGRGIARGIVR